MFADKFNKLVNEVVVASNKFVIVIVGIQI